MTKPKSDDTDIPETKPEDWTGAAIRRGGARGPLRAKPGGMIFHIFQASDDSGLFAVSDSGDGVRLPPCPGRGAWVPFKAVPEAGTPRVGFSETAAKADIEKQGYHLLRVGIDTKIHVVARP